MAEWSDFQTSVPKPPDAAGWDQYQRVQPSLPPPASGAAADAIATNERQGSVLSAFGQGFKEQWGEPNIGTELKDLMDEHGILYGGPKTLAAAKKPISPYKAMSEGVLRTAADVLDYSIRSTYGAYEGLKQSFIQAGANAGHKELARDIANLPGDINSALPGLIGVHTPIHFESPILAGPHNYGMFGEYWFPSRVALAKTGDARIDAVLDHPVVQNTVDHPNVDREHTVPYTAGGSVPAEDPTMFIDHRFPKSFTIDGVTFDPAEPFAIHENVEQHVMEQLIKGGMTHEEAYRVAHFEFAEKAEGAWYASKGISKEKAEAAYAPYMAKIQKGADDNPPPNLYDKPYPKDNTHLAAGEHIAEAKPTPEEIQRANDILDAGVLAYHGSSHNFEAFKSAAIGSGQGAQSFGHGHYVAEEPNVAISYRREGSDVKINGRLFNPNDPLHAAVQLVDEFGSKYAAIKEAEARQAHDPGDFFNDVLRNLKREKPLPEMDREGNLYTVRVHANPDEMLDWDKPPNRYVQDALLKSGLVNQNELNSLSQMTGEDIHNYLTSIIRKKWMQGDIPLGDVAGKTDNEVVKARTSQALNDAGIPGIKYLDQGSRRPIEAELGVSTKGYKAFQQQFEDIRDQLREISDQHSEEGAAFEGFHLYDELQKTKDKLIERANKEYPGPVEQTRNFVVFDERNLEITHKNGERVFTQSDLEEAKRMGVVGKEPTSISEGTPAEAAARMTNQDLVKRSTPGKVAPVEQNPWQDRFDQWVTKLQVPEDVKTLIRNAAQTNENFPEARAGEIPKERLGALSDATGIPVEEMDESKMRLVMRNDAEFRVAAQLMIKTNDDVFEAARNHATEGTFETRQALVAAIMRRDLALEGVLGLRAEWGRTGNVMQEFLDSVKDSQSLGRFLKDKKGEGWNSEKLDDIADKLRGMNSREAQGRFLTELRRPDFLDKTIWYWTNSILSGLLTHTKYVFANAAYIAHDTFIATPLAGVSGLIRGDVDRVYMGETVAKTIGLIMGVPDAIVAAGRAIKNNAPTALEAQIRGAGTLNPITQLQPISGIAGNIMGVPSRSIAGIHSFFNFLGYRAEIEAQGYRAAIKAGFKPTERGFWQAYRDSANFPDDPAMDAAILAGQRANFVQDLGPSGKALQTFLYKTRIGRFIIPFTKVPGNIFNTVQEGTPLAYLDARMRADLTGTGPARDLANGRLAAGAAVMATAAYWTLSNKITGNGPIDPKQRSEWLLTHQPRSFQQDGVWKSVDRFGPVGGWLTLSADITDASNDVLKALQDGRLTETQARKADKDLEEGYSRIVTGFTHWFDDAGLQGLSDFVEAMNDPQQTRASNAGRIASTALPFSSFQSQLASFNDPYMRQTQTFLDGIKKAIPGERSTLPVVRDWSGAPRPNPMYHSLVANQDVNNDSVDREMQRLDLKPQRVEDNIRGVKLTQAQYDEYQTYAGVATRNALHQKIDQPTWQRFPDFAKAKVIEAEITASRKQAEATMMMKYPSIIQEAVDNRKADIAGQKPKPNAFDRP